MNRPYAAADLACAKLTPSRQRAARARCAALRAFGAVLLAAALSCSGSHGEDSTSKQGAAAAAEASTKSAATPATEAPLVEVAKPRRGIARETITLNGDLRAQEELDLTSRVTAVVLELYIREGDEIAAGAPLVRLDSAELELVERQERLAHEDAVARAASVRLDLDELRQNADLARLSFEKCNKDLERFDRLLTSGARTAFSEEEHDAKRYALDEARIALEKAELALERGAVQSQLAEIATQRLAASWERARLDVSRCKISSPIDGAVSFLEVHPGELVQSGTRVASVVNRRELYTEVRVPQRRLGALALGQAVEIQAETFAEERFAGRVDGIHPTIDAAEGTVKVRIRVEDPSRRLRPGSYVSVTIITASFDSALLIPKRARLLESARSHVFVVRDGIARRLTIATGVQTVEELQVIEVAEDGIRDDDLLIVRGQDRLKDGTAVRSRTAGSMDDSAGGAAAAPNTPAPESSSESKDSPPSDSDTASGQG
ncbi:MAG: efflux RND transporter periplasmic adaptor subunit [Planctomycetes bacterium]|nr:efflux RND transporter periplasmic adaptor subunit [Planctomycetota bacterium]